MEATADRRHRMQQRRSQGRIVGACSFSRQGTRGRGTDCTTGYACEIVVDRATSGGVHSAMLWRGPEPEEEASARGQCTQAGRFACHDMPDAKMPPPGTGAAQALSLPLLHAVGRARLATTSAERTPPTICYRSLLFRPGPRPGPSSGRSRPGSLAS